MSHAIYAFLDGEILHGDPPPREFDSPVLETAIHNVGSNNRGAFVPLNSLKYVLFDSHAPTGELDLRQYHRIAIHFVDHEVLRGYSERQLRSSRYGVTLSLVSPDFTEVKELGIPYNAIKGIFYLKTWSGGDSPVVESDWVPRKLEEREREQRRVQYAGAGPPRTRMPLLERILRTRRQTED